MPELFSVEVAGVDGTAIVVASGELDLGTAPLLRESLGRLHGCVVVDLAGVTFLDASAIGVLISQRNRLRNHGGELVLRGPHGVVRRAIEVVGLADWIE